MGSKRKSTVIETDEYDRFILSDDNRPISLDKHKKLQASLDTYKFLDVSPIVTGKLL